MSNWNIVMGGVLRPEDRPKITKWSVQAHKRKPCKRMTKAEAEREDRIRANAQAIASAVMFKPQKFHGETIPSVQREGWMAHPVNKKPLKRKAVRNDDYRGCETLPLPEGAFDPLPKRTVITSVIDAHLFSECMAGRMTWEQAIRIQQGAKAGALGLGNNP